MKLMAFAVGSAVPDAMSCCQPFVAMAALSLLALPLIPVAFRRKRVG